MMAGLSTALGYASILAWLGAQMPQVYENYRNGSVAGLALPFLVSWMVGDATNLIGCILTHQLPFQRYLATYFVLVDFCLLSQFAYYSRTHPSLALPPLPHPPTPHTPRLGEDPRRSYLRAARSESWAGAGAFPGTAGVGGGRHHAHHKRGSKSASRRAGSRAGTGSRSASGTGTGEASDREGMGASWLSEVSGGTAKSPVARQGQSALKGARKASGSGRREGFDSPEDATSPNLSHEARGRSLTRPPPPPMRMRPTPTQPNGHHFGDLDTIAGSPSFGAPAFPAFAPHPPHHRSLSHASALQVAFDPSGPTVLCAGDEGDQGQEDDDARRHPSRSSSRMSRAGRAGERAPPPARRSASMVFLSVGMLVVFGRWAGGGGGGVDVARGTAWSTGVQDGAVVAVPRRAWAGVQHPAFFSRGAVAEGRTSAPAYAQRAKRQAFPLDVSSPPPAPGASIILLEATDPPSDSPDNDDGDAPWAPHRNWERFIGRASAWLCTSLYLTSRLPQIWQNFRRRSVDGLAMMLFIMAFVGNSLYVASILTNPLLRSQGYLLESTPYLLGSGGTLCFDITIVLQSYLYSPERRARRERARRRELAGKYGLGEEEEEALLRHAGEGDGDGEGEEGTDGQRTPHRSRSRSAHPTSTQRASRSRTASRTGTTKAKSCSRSRGSSLARPEARELEEVEPASGVDWSRLEVEVAERSGRDIDRERSLSTGRPGAGRSRTSSGSVLSGSREETIAEEGESTVTLRG